MAIFLSPVHYLRVWYLHVWPLFVLPPLLSAGSALLSLPARAQTNVSHNSVYTSPVTVGAVSATGGARTNLPVVDPGKLPLSVLKTHNSLPVPPLAPVPGATSGSSDGIHRDFQASPSAYGNSGPVAIAPYTIARASATVLGPTSTAAAVGVTSFPWRATGKLTFKIGRAPYVCSGSLIGPGLLVTAAHCVYEFGRNNSTGWHTDFVFSPAEYAAGVVPPYGTWTAKNEIISTSYLNGKDTCTQKGVICNNDIAIIVMAPNSAGKLPGNVLGWYSYSWNGYSYIYSFGNASLSSITQLGYPEAFDAGVMMERTDGVGAYWSSGNLKNTVLGSAQTGGSSGGPWLVNFGAVPNVTTGSASLGNATNSNVVVGVTSWNYGSSVGNNTQGASWFGENVEYPKSSYLDNRGFNRGAGNIGSLVASACNAAPNYTYCP